MEGPAERALVDMQVRPISPENAADRPARDLGITIGGLARAAAIPQVTFAAHNFSALTINRDGGGARLFAAEPEPSRYLQDRVPIPWRLHYKVRSTV